MIKKIMNLLAHLVELNLKIERAEYGSPARESLESKAKDIYLDAMGMAHGIGCTIWCDATRDSINYQLVGKVGAVIDQTR